ncbi:MAG: glycosyl hydrolase [Gemmatimonadota bacterium]|nr:glycosyl hydrolase [Gemmatimonadota bacterium]
MPLRAILWRPVARVILVFAAATSVARGQSRAIDPRLLGLVEWRSLGPSRGGRSLAVAGDPRDRLVAYMGSTGGGVWKTENAGVSWRNISDGYFATGAVGAVALAPSDSRVIYVGMGEACIRGDVSHGDGVYKSIDAGRSWTHVGLQATRHIARVRVHPTNPEIVYVAALGDAFGPSADRGVFRSTDGGATWKRILYRDENTGAIDLTMDPANPAVLYASMLEERRFPWGLRSAGPGTGLFKSTDGGDTWTEITGNPGLPKGTKGRIGLALSPANPQRIYAIVDAKYGDKGVFRSDDAGATWQRMSDNADLTQRPWYYHHIFADPQNQDVVYVLNVQMWKSSDGGRTWSEIRPPHGDNHDLWIDPADPRRLVQANDGGATISFDGGLSWSSELNQATAQFYHVTTDDQFPYRIYGPQQDEGGISIPSRSDFGSITQAEWETVGGGESGYIAVDQRNPNQIFAAEHHWLEHYDRATRQRRDISPWPTTWYGWGARDITYRFNWTYPVVLSHDQSALYVTSQVVHRSTNRGQSWSVVSPDLTRHDSTRLERTPSYGHEEVGPYWGPITRDNTGIEWYSVIFAFAESPLRKGVLWAGSDDGLVHVSRDGGGHWENVTPRELPEFSLVSIIDPSPLDAGTAYLAATRYKLQDRHPYLYRTTDYGKSWTKIVGGIPDDDFTRVIRADPGRRGLLYAGTETGVYVSFDDGSSWQSLRLNLPVVPIHDLTIRNGDLIAATHGRSFWAIDDVAALHQLGDSLTGAAMHLFHPRRTVRFRGNASLAGFEGGDPSAGRNPPGGVVFRYYFAEKPQGDVTLTITDAAGKTIRSFTAASGTDSASTGRNGARARRGGGDRFRAAAGMNRFVWDMRYPGATVLSDVVIQGSATGPLATPGAYSATLVSGERRATTRFEIVKDPRVSATAADLAEQFRFLIAVRDKLTQTHEAVRSIREMRRQLQAGPSAGGGSARRRALGDTLWMVEEVLAQFRARAGQDLSNYPTSIDSKLASLLDFAGQADARPTAQDYTLFRTLSAVVDRQRAVIDRLRGTAAGGSAPP